MLTQNLIFHVYLKKPKNYNKGPMPLYLRLTLNGDRQEISLCRKWEPEKWNANAQKAVGNKEDAKQLNAFIDSLRFKALKVQQRTFDMDEPISVEELKRALSGKAQKQPQILEVFKKHNDELKMLIGKEYALSTVVRYSTALEHTKAFITWKYKHEDLEISKLDYEFVSQFEFWFKSVRNCNHNSTIKYISNFRKVVNRCVKYGMLVRDPFAEFQMKKKEVIPDFLSNIELKLIMEKTFASQRLTQVRDVFVFCCYTGLAFIDVKQLRKSDIRPGIDGTHWIFIKRQKTQSESRIPLLPVAAQLIAKYAFDEACKMTATVLPVLSNQKYNEYLKEIANLCGIHKSLTTHAARHTFATTVTLSNGVPIESVSKMLGHKNLRTTQHYSKVLDLKVSHDMEQLQVRMKNF